MNRSELLFLYDIADANPNGDPLDSNKPRIDEETEINLVTDVRLKRTIRDYLHDFKDQDIFIIEKRDENDKIEDAKKRAEWFKPDKDYSNIKDVKEDIEKNILNDCIDVRLFGATIPLTIKIKNKNENSSIALTGPVQFRMGRSLNKVEIEQIKGTGAFASGEGKDQKTFREEYILPYSLIGFYGIVNENAANTTNLSDEDVQSLLDGMWNGTKNLISRSKFGQTPRILLQIEYNEDNFFIGDLNNKISITHNYDDDKKLRKINELEIDLSSVINSLMENKDKIKKINYKIDDEVRLKGDISIEELLNDFEISEINF